MVELSGIERGGHRRVSGAIQTVLSTEPNFCPPLNFPVNGGAKRDRTADLLRARQALSQLSYSPIVGATENTEYCGPER